MIVLERHRRHHRAEHDVPLLEQRRPLALQPRPGVGRRLPVAPADIGAADVDRIEALVVGPHRRRDRAHPFVVLGRTALVQHRAEQAHVVAGRLGEIGQQRALPRHGGAFLAEAIGRAAPAPCGSPRRWRPADACRSAARGSRAARDGAARGSTSRQPTPSRCSSGPAITSSASAMSPRAARHRPDHRQAVAGRRQGRQPREGVAARRHDAVARLVGEHAAIMRRRAQRAADVGAEPRAPRSPPPAPRPSRPTSRRASARYRRDCWWCRRSDWCSASRPAPPARWSCR